MVEFMLYNAGKKHVGGEFSLVSFQVEISYFDFLASCYPTGNVREAQSAFVGDGRAAFLDNLRIDKREVLALFVAPGQDDKHHGNTDLACGESDALCGAHRLGHSCGKPANFIIHVADQLRRLFKHGVGIYSDIPRGAFVGGIYGR